MSIIPQYSYVTTAYFISVWLPLHKGVPLYHFLVYFLLSLIRGIAALAGAQVDDYTIYLWWTWLSVTLAVVAAWIFRLLMNNPEFFSLKVESGGTVMIKFPLSVALFIAATVPYGVYPPSEGTFWGLIASLLTTTIVIGFTSLWISNDVRSDAHNDNHMVVRYFVWWVLSNIFLSMFFFVERALAEQWVALIASGSLLVAMGIAAFTVLGVKRKKDKVATV